MIYSSPTAARLLLQRLGWRSLPRSHDMYYGMHGLERVGWALPTYIHVNYYINLYNLHAARFGSPQTKFLATPMARLMATPEPLNTVALWCLWGFKGALIVLPLCRKTQVSRTAVRLIVVFFPAWKQLFDAAATEFLDGRLFDFYWSRNSYWYNLVILINKYLSHQ